MTFIASLKVSHGIVQISDSLELQTGAILRFDDFKKILDSKGIDEENKEVKLTANEIWRIFKPERIKNIEGARKTFRISDSASVQIAGSVCINGQQVKELVKQCSDLVTTENKSTHQDIIDCFMSILKPNFPEKEIDEYENRSSSANFADATFLCSIYCPNTGAKYIHTLKYAKNNRIRKYHFTDMFEGVENHIYFSAGMIGLSTNFEALNYTATFKPLTFRQGFQVLKSAMELAIISEHANYDVSAVGGSINYSIIDKDGFRFIKDEASLPFE